MARLLGAFNCGEGPPGPHTIEAVEKRIAEMMVARDEACRLRDQLKEQEEINKVHTQRQVAQDQKVEELERKLREMGVCVAGFRWIRESSGYRCAGGFHYVSLSELER